MIIDDSLVRFVPSNHAPEKTAVRYVTVAPTPSREERELRELLRHAIEDGTPLTFHVCVSDTASLRALLEGRSIKVAV